MTDFIVITIISLIVLFSGYTWITQKKKECSQDCQSCGLDSCSQLKKALSQAKDELAAEHREKK